ncbi:GlxA family transcriptional regulator [Aurantivibrio infirmus]
MNQRRIQFLLVEDMLATSATLPAEMLLAAESIARGKRHPSPALNIVRVATQQRAIHTQAGFAIKPDRKLQNPEAGDIIYVPALWRNPRPVVLKNYSVIDWLKKGSLAGATIAGVGTGCCFLAEAGLLNGKPATTHWHYFDRFEKDYPKVKLKRDFFITQADETYCAASLNSLADLTVHFIQDIFGKDIAHQVERNFSHEIRQPYESMRYFEGSTNKHADETVLQIQIWLQDNYQKEIILAELAKQFDMSVRSFNRRFKLATGKSPLQYLQEIRMATARDLLQASNLNVSEIAYNVGYQDLGHFSALFKKLYHATPQDYRTTVRAKLFQL